MNKSDNEHSPPERNCPEVGILLPIYNEGAHLEKLTWQIVEELNRNDVRLIVALVDDGSTDNSSSVIDSLEATDPRLIGVKHKCNRGYGAAVRTGIAALLDRDVEWIMLLDADETMHPEDIAGFRERILAGDDLVIGSRYNGLKAAAVEGQPFPKRRTLISWLGSFVARTFIRLPLIDFTLGMRAFRSDLARRFILTSSTFAVLMEMVAEADRLGAQASNIPIQYRNRVSGKSKFHYRPRLFLEYLRFAVGCRLRWLYPGKP